MRKVKQSTAKNVMVLLVDGTDHVTGKTGLTLTVTASKDGGAFASISPTVTERGDGWYNLALTSGHTDTLGDLALHITAASADPADLVLLVEAGAVDADISTRSTYAGGAVASVTGSVGSVTGLTVANLDVAVSTRLAAAGYTAPDNVTITALDARLPSDPADQSLLAAAIAAIPAAPTAAAIRAEIDSNSTKLDAAVSSRLASASYTAPNNAGITAIDARLPSDPADQSLLAAAIAAISVGSAPTAEENADAVLAAALLTPISANVKAFNDTGIAGSGNPTDPIRVA